MSFADAILAMPQLVLVTESSKHQNHLAKPRMAFLVVTRLAEGEWSSRDTKLET